MRVKKSKKIFETPKPKKKRGVVSTFWSVVIIILILILLSAMLLPSLSQSRAKSAAISAANRRKMQLQREAISELAQEAVYEDNIAFAPASAPEPALDSSIVVSEFKAFDAPKNEWAFKAAVGVKKREEVLHSEVKNSLEMVSPEQEPFSTFGADVDNQSYIATRTQLRGKLRPHADDIRPEEFINYFGNEIELPEKGEVFRLKAEMSQNGFRHYNHSLLVTLRSKVNSRYSYKTQNYTILVDASGSMALPARWENAQKCVAELQDKLEKNGQVKVKYCHSGTVIPSGSSTIFEELKRSNKQSGTIFIITDGDEQPKDSVEYGLLLDKASQQRAHGMVTVFSVGELNNHAFWEQLAEKGGGALVGIENPQVAQEFFANELDNRLQPVADDLKIQLEFNPAIVKEYRLIGYVERRLKAQDFRNDKIRTTPVGADNTLCALYELKLHSDIGDNALAGTFRIRYRNIDTPGMAEQSLPIITGNKEFRDMPEAYRTAVIAGEFAEMLKYPTKAQLATANGMLELLPPFPKGRAVELKELLNLIK